MQKWQNENKEQRAVFCVTSSEETYGGMLFGAGLPIIAALVKLTEQDEDYKGLIKAVNEAINNPIGKALVYAEWEKFKKERGIKNCDGDEKETPDKSSSKSFLKDLLQTLADKL